MHKDVKISVTFTVNNIIRRKDRKAQQTDDNLTCTQNDREIKSKLKQFQVSKFPKFIHFKLHIEKKIYSAEIVTVIRMVLVPVYIYMEWLASAYTAGHNF